MGSSVRSLKFNTVVSLPNEKKNTSVSHCQCVIEQGFFVNHNNNNNNT